MKRVYQLVLALSLGLLPFAPHSAEVSGLYEAEIPVANQSAAERRRALSTALEQVLVKVSGYGRIGIDPAVSDALGNPNPYVQQFGYVQVPREQLQNEPGMAPLIFRVSFQPTAVRELLRRNDLPVWGALRPRTLVWIAIEERGERRLLAANQEQPPEQVLTGRAEARGLPLRLPLLDLMDQRRIGVVDVWGEFRETIIEASQRYDADAILIGRVHPDYAGQWRAQWVLYSGEQMQRWESVEMGMADTVAAGVDGAADALALQYAQLGPDTRGDVFLRVSAVKDLEGYGRVTEYLEGLSGVRMVWPVEIGADTVDYRISLEIPVRTMVQTISLGNTLGSVRRAAGDDPEIELNYRLLP